jgi:hypothetical protein
MVKGLDDGWHKMRAKGEKLAIAEEKSEEKVSPAMVYWSAIKVLI